MVTRTPRTIVWTGIGLVLLMTALAACSDHPASSHSDPLGPFSDPAFSQSSSDTVYWVNDVLEFEYEGDTIRVERDQENATVVDLYWNGHHEFSTELIREQGSVVGWRIINPDDGFFLDIDEEGTILSVAGNTSCTPDHMDPECPEPEFDDPCVTLAAGAIGSALLFAVSAGTAAGGGIVSVFTGGASAPVSGPVVGAGLSGMKYFGGAGLGAAAAWWACKQLSDGGEDECEEEEEEECLPDESLLA